MKTALSIIIVSYNTKDLLKQCLESICKTMDMSKYKLEIIVVDNGSTDGSAQLVKSLRLKLKSYKVKFKVILNKKNLGFAKAVNQGIRISEGKYILLLNSDIIVRPKAIETMVDFVKKNSRAGVVGGKLLNQDGSTQGSCFYFPTLRRVVKEFFLGDKKNSVTKKFAPVGLKPVEVEAVVGAVFLIPRRIIDEVGFFNERYFMYFEDLDYCRRLKKAGFKVYWLPQAEFIHYHGVSGRKIPKKTHQWLVESSKIYHGKIKYYLITFIIWVSQKCQRLFRR